MEEIKDIDSLFSELKTTIVKTGPELDTENGNLYDIAVEYYGEEYVEKINKQCIVIHFPVIEITSNGSDRSKHMIYDLYVKLDFTSGVIKGLRTSYVKKEIINFPQVNYIHSHLSTTSINIEQHITFDNNFCLGSSELLNAFSFIKSQYTIKPNQKLNDDLYYYLFSNLDTYLTIENHKDGGSPYRRNGSIANEIANNDCLRSSSSRITDTVNYFIDNLFYEVIGNKIEFSDTYENWKIFLAEHGAQGIEQDMGEYDISQGCGVNKTKGIASINLNLSWKMDCFRFKGKPIEFKIKDELNINSNEINEIYPKKVFINEVKRRFNEITTNYANKHIENYTKTFIDSCQDANRLVWKAMDAPSS